MQGINAEPLTHVISRTSVHLVRFFNPPRPSLVKEGTFRSTSSLLCQGGLHILTKPSLLEGKDVTALRCSEPLRSKVGGASKPSPDLRAGTAWGQLASNFIAPGELLKSKKSVRSVRSVWELLKVKNLRHLRNLRDF